MKNIGVLWDDEVVWDSDIPFDHKNAEKDFAVYSNLAREEGLEMYIGHFSWYEDEKMVKAWHWNGNEWHKVHDVALDAVYDKYKYDDDTKELKDEIADKIPVLNDPELEYLCKDKLKTYELLPEHVPETKIATRENVEYILHEYGKAVFKPRYGAAGQGVEVLESLDQFKRPDSTENFVVQRFISTEGIPELAVEGPHDIRTHVINGELLEGNYVRVPREGLISNVSLGGDQMYVDNSEIPESAKRIVSQLAEQFKEYEPNLFAVDFMFDDSGKPWVVELNSKPGMYYHYPVKKKEYELPRMKALVNLLSQLAEKG